MTAPQVLPISETPANLKIPETLEDLGISRTMVTDLVLRYLWTNGAGTLRSLRDTLKLSFPVLETLFHELRQQHLLEVKGMQGDDYRFTLTATGRTLASARQEVCQYTGPAPVSIQHYQRMVGSQTATVRLNRESLRKAYDDLVIPDGMLDQLGPSLIRQRSLFLYGATGGGKTSIAERITRVYDDTVAIPYAIEVDGNIITVFDPVVHDPVHVDDDVLDPRWVMCQRPCIKVGGELSAAMLELSLDRSTNVSIAPCQMKANNGVLIIDDFGRQVLSPRELLNRWIVPLDRHVDYLTLSSGMKFKVPFELLVVFSTNLNPHELADEAFLRRIQTKVLIEDVSDETFDRIFERVATAGAMLCESGVSKYLRGLCLAEERPLRACYPGDIVRIVKAISEYEGQEPVMNRANIDRAVRLYFAKIPQARS